MERLKCNLTFRELRKDENLYDDVVLITKLIANTVFKLNCTHN